MNVRKWFFHLQYLFFDPPWDTGITPPELMDFIEHHSPGRALDLGCGTGTNALTLARHGWLVRGVDFVPRAIRAARRKVRRAGYGDQVEFQVADVLRLKIPENTYDLVLDIGCFHGLAGQDIQHYSRLVTRALAPGGSLLMYTHLNRDDSSPHGARESDLDKLAGTLNLIQRVDGEEGSRPSTWLEFQKAALSSS